MRKNKLEEQSRDAKRPASILRLCFFAAQTALFLSCTPSKTDTSKALPEGSPKFQQYYVHGEELYLRYCSNCHQKNGTGLARLYPPVATSDYVDKNKDAVICLIRNGKSGPVTVNGVSFNKVMQPIPALTDIEIAEIATYLYNTWNRNEGIVEVQHVSKVLTSCDTIPQ
ncbi:c-type cytochrome [Chryseolinea soli]|uniref:Cytochrome c n=1 Tax=Chryseolinea soli TaxID=2321403 RepID=A0A385SLP3_9BACT|nr:cytochrome c [Chryseolinea soli]AYB31281.1 cytochrome c [Chryseolinea soli]